MKANKLRKWFFLFVFPNKILFMKTIENCFYELFLKLFFDNYYWKHSQSGSQVFVSLTKTSDTKYILTLNILEKFLWSFLPLPFSLVLPSPTHGQQPQHMARQSFNPIIFRLKLVFMVSLSPMQLSQPTQCFTPKCLVNHSQCILRRTRKPQVPVTFCTKPQLIN